MTNTAIPHLAAQPLVIASHNAGKVAEIGELIAPLGIRVLSATEAGIDEPEETGQTFADNAALKAAHATHASGLPALADDSGLVVPAIDGAPGIHSARWAGPDRDFSVAIERVIAALRARYGSFAAADLRAAFVAVLCLAWPDGHLELFEGRCEGHLVERPRGPHAFGYDPIFVPADDTRTFAEMSAAEKHSRSHRGR